MAHLATDDATTQAQLRDCHLLESLTLSFSPTNSFSQVQLSQQPNRKYVRVVTTSSFPTSPAGYLSQTLCFTWMTELVPTFQKKKKKGRGHHSLSSYFILNPGQATLPLCPLQGQSEETSVQKQLDSRPSTWSTTSKSFMRWVPSPPASSICNWLKPKWKERNG